MRCRMLFVFVLVTMLTSIASAGEYYLSEDKAYWWYWDDAPKYEIMVPAKAESYAPRNVFEERSLDITLAKNGPIFRVSSVNKVNGGYAALKKSVLDRWQHVLTGIKVTTDTDITTSRGVKAKFLVASGKSSSGTPVMIRLVAYFNGNSVVYIELWCQEKAYAGEVRNQWIKAVNTFKWRS